jgi:polyvinyl alcohol dehydrogenase (cytochrome)
MTTRTSRRHLVAMSTVPAALAIAPGLAQNATPVPAGTPAPATPAVSPVALPGWPLYGRDLTGARATSAAGISSGNVADLVPLWQVEVGGAVSATPVIADGVAYVGSYDGNLYAVDALTGAEVWTYATGAAVNEPNLGIPLGIPGSAAVDGGVVYVGDATATVHAIQASTGTVLWQTKVDQQANACIWSSPVLWNDMVFIGVASVAKEAGFRGSVVALSARTGELAWQTYMVPEGADGAGVFAVPAIDPERGTLYVGTQNAYSDSTVEGAHAISLVALNALTGGEVWAFDAIATAGDGAYTDDIGFSASPNLFTIEADGGPMDLVGCGQKSGSWWALNRETSEVVWQAVVSPAGFLGGMEGTSAVHDNVVVVPATDWPEFDGPAMGLVSAYDADTGLRRWTKEQEGFPAASAVSITEDLVFQAGMDGILHAYLLPNGVELWSAELGASASGGIGIADGVVIVGAATPEFAPFVTPGNTVQAFGFAQAETVPAATPIASPVS